MPDLYLQVTLTNNPLISPRQISTFQLSTFNPRTNAFPTPPMSNPKNSLNSLECQWLIGLLAGVASRSIQYVVLRSSSSHAPCVVYVGMCLVYSGTALSARIKQCQQAYGEKNPRRKLGWRSRHAGIILFGLAVTRGYNWGIRYTDTPLYVSLDRLGQVIITNASGCWDAMH